MINIFSWFFRPTEENKNESIFDKIQKLEDRIAVLEEANIEQTNALYECCNSIDARIDILVENCRVNYDV